jgi:flagellar motor protein MotB
MRCLANRLSVSVCVAMAIAAGGCAHNPFRTAPPATITPASLEPPPGVAAPAHTLPQAIASPPAPSYADVDGRQLATALTRSNEQTQLMQDEITALREQLASTSAQLAQTRAAGPPAGAASAARPVTDGGAAPAVAGGPISPATMRSAMGQLTLPGIDARFDGAVVRIDLPADKLFEDGTANLLPGGAATLTQVAGELERVFPGHFIGIEGHLDTEPLQNSTWASAHQLTAARSAAVFDFLTTRTKVHEGQLFLVAHGANHPLVSNATAAGRSRNRRVELVVYAERAAAK